ncbi:MAG: twin-arginine translocation signal domain-containing protein, partial [Candidatus Acidiferrales bacterium]
MGKGTSRRDFLEMSALGLAAAIVPNAAVEPGEAVTGPGNKIVKSDTEISIWVTSGDDRFAAAPRAKWGPALGTPGADSIRLK